MKKFIDFLCKPVVAAVTGIVSFVVGLGLAPANAGVDVLRTHGLRAVGLYLVILIALLVARFALWGKAPAPVETRAEVEPE